MAYKFILFDHDGVLVDTERWYFEATRRALAEIDITLEQEVYMQYMVRGVASWILAEKNEVPADKIAEQKVRRDAWYQEYLQSEDISIDGVEETLRQLQEMSYRMAIVTTSKTRDFDLIHQSRNLIEPMEFILKREDYIHSKPNSEPYLKALERFGAEPGEALVIEDSERGLRAAVAAGIDCAVVHNDFTAGHNFSGAKYRLKNLGELIALLSGYASRGE